MIKKICSVLAAVFFFTAFAWTQNRDIAAMLGYPQTIVFNAKIITVDDASFNPTVGAIAQAMAIRDQKILAVGDNNAIRALAGPETRLIDLQGRTVVPGLIMVHNHPMDWAPVVPEIMDKVVPREVMVTRVITGSPQEQLDQLPQVLRETVQEAPPGAWVQILLVWDINVLPDDPLIHWAGVWITKEQLDRAAPNNPVMVRSRESILRQGREGMMNQKAVEVVRQVNPPDQMEGRNNLAYEERTGVMSGSVYRMIIPEVIFKDRLDLYSEIFRLDLSWWAAKGQTTFGSYLYHFPNIIKAYRLLDRKGELDNRVAWGWGSVPRVAEARDFQDPFLVADLATREGTGTDYMWYIGTGGSLGRQCVSMEPLPSRDTRIKLIMPGGGCEGGPEPGGPLWKIVKDGGRVLAGHQWGDVPIEKMMDMIEQASKEGGFTPEEIRARRHAADHMNGWPRPDQIPRMKELGMIGGGTNLYIYEDSPRWMRDYGEKAVEMVVPRNGLAQAGIMSGIEIDKPIELTDLTAFAPLSWAITRKAQDGNVYAPQQRLSRELALKTATIWGAYYVLKENVLGSLEPGKFADFLVLDKDYLTIPEDQIETIRVLMTVVGDEVVHLVPSLAQELGIEPRGAEVELGGPAASY
ncbi:MAG: amidohydrolase family protein [Acidobacteria bacterium]|nr:amidohydrolase family protein [Acidobacteriota bacterium]